MIKRILAMVLTLCVVFASIPCALAACDVCGGDGKCNDCLGLGFVMAKMYGSDELVQIGCPGKNCDGGTCTACADAQDEPPATVYDNLMQWVYGGSAAPSGAPAAQMHSDTDVYAFEDASVEQAVRSALEKEKITYADLKTVTKISISLDADVSSIALSDVAHMPALEELFLRCSEARPLEVDIAPLAGAASLSDLYFHHVKEIKNLGIVRQLPSLNTLCIANCAWLTDEAVSVLNGMEQLVSLTLSKTAITDISWMAELTNLVDVGLSGTNITDVSALAALPKLGIVSLDGLPDACDMTCLLGKDLDQIGGPVIIEEFDDWYADLCFDKGYACKADGDYAGALMWYERAAKAGSVSAMNNLGVMYEYGQGVEASPEIAVAFYQKAADRGSIIAVTNLACCYENGRGGLDKNYEKAAELYRKAAQSGNARAMNNLGYMYESGYGVAKSLETAIEWYEKAAAAGDETAKRNLENMKKEPEPKPQKKDDDDDNRTGDSTRCSSCSGTGRTRSSCSSCGGDGEKNCISCGGDGTYDCGGCYNGTNRCGSCGGTGKTSGDRRCSSCSGSGEKRCSSCSGTGERRCTGCGGSGDDRCSSCSGRGYKESSCSSCGGDGKR